MVNVVWTFNVVNRGQENDQITPTGKLTKIHTLELSKTHTGSPYLLDSTFEFLGPTMLTF